MCNAFGVLIGSFDSKPELGIIRREYRRIYPIDQAHHLSPVINFRNATIFKTLRCRETSGALVVAATGRVCSHAADSCFDATTQILVRDPGKSCSDFANSRWSTHVIRE
jgi:hypothetical protein